MTIFTNVWTRSVVVQSLRKTCVFMEKKSNCGIPTGSSNCSLKTVKRLKHRLDLTGASDTDLPNKKMRTHGTERMENEQIKQNIQKKFKVTFDTSPTKSVSDDKEYLVMKLSNGLTVLLISDVKNLINLSEVLRDEGVGDEASDDESSSSEEVAEDPESSAEIKDEQEEKKEKLAACALTVGVGSFSDPDIVPGLAHFLEHMLFMGSKKFPKENDFDSYISTKGGSTNASTECEYTSFYFDCPDKYLYCSMDRFSNFFVSPLMKRDSMSREREAVESEFQLSLSSDSSRTEQLFCSTAPSDNPAHKFMWGNLITLQKNVTDDVLYNTLRDFWNNEYSANRMTLAVQARLPLDVLGTWVAQLFGEIPSNYLPKKAFPYVNPPFKKELFNKIYTVKPVKDTNKLLLTWSCPSVTHLYKSKPLSYLSFLIGHEGEGSLLSYLQEKLWALQITVGCSDTGVENNTIYSLFSVNIELTDKGLNHIKDIIELVFMYIKLLKDEGPSELIFKEMQIIDEMEFRFQHESEASDYVEELSVNMQFYPPTDYMTGNKLLFEYQPDEIVKFLSLMNPDNVNVMILSKTVAKNATLDQAEPWFNTKFKLEDIPEDWSSDWHNCEVDPKLHLPKPNIYIPNDFQIITPTDPPQIPKNILKNEYIEVWYKPDIKFKLPYGYIKIYMISPVASSSPQNSVLCNIFISLFNLLVIKETYPASLAGLDYSLALGDSGFVLSFSGFNDKMPLLLTKVLTEMVSFARNKNVSEGLFEAVKTRQKQGYQNGTLKASKLAKELRLSILCTEFWSCVNKLEAMQDVTIEKLIEFNYNFFENLYVKCLIQGNISKNLAVDMSYKIKEIIGHKPLITGTYPQVRTRVLPPNERIIRVQSLSTQDTNCNVTNYYQCGLNNIVNSCIVEILLLIMEEPLFDKLRTQEQLAYEVSCEIKDTQGVLGFTITVKSQADKFSVGYVENRISLFLENLMPALESMSPAHFCEIKESLKILKLQEDTHLKDEVKRNWGEIMSDEYMFDRLGREVTSIDTIQHSDLVQYYKKILNPGNVSNLENNFAETCLRKLSVQVDAEGHPKTEADSTVEDKDNLEHIDPPPVSVKSKLQFKKSSDKDLQSKFITDIEQFKSKLFIFPYNCHVSCRL